MPDLPRRRRPGGGRKRKPPELHILHGTFKSQHGDQAAMNLTHVERPACPPHLVAYDPLCAEYWKTTCDLIESYGLPFAGIGMMLELFVRGYADMRTTMQHKLCRESELHRLVKRKVKLPGREIEEEYYEVKSNPVRRELRQITAELHRLAIDLGLTSSGRARLMAELGGAVPVTKSGAMAGKPQQATLGPVETRRRG